MNLYLDDSHAVSENDAHERLGSSMESFGRPHTLKIVDQQMLPFP